ncbi:MAG: hypothetical protein HC774_03595 [Sphingomonadales bacterium]|nr:hypothetical protein [Sphingomonadales bacterium]
MMQTLYRATVAGVALCVAAVPGAHNAGQVFAQQRDGTQAGYALAFEDADVARVVDAVLGAMLGVEYSIDPAVTGTINLRSSGPVPRERLVPLLENALRGLNAVIVVRDGRYLVLPRDSARSRAPVSSDQLSWH